MKERLETAVHAWLRELQEPSPAPERLAAAAQQVALHAAGEEEMRRLVAAIQSDVEDHIDCTVCQERLPEYMAAQIGGDAQRLGNAPMIEVRDHLSLCPYCTAAYAQVSEWMSVGEVDAVPPAPSYPDFDLPVSALSKPPTQPPTSTSSFAAGLQAIAAQGRRWVEDTRGGIYLLLDPRPLAAAWAVKSGEESSLLAHTVVGEEEIPGWEVEASAFAGEVGSGLCSIEVAIFRPGAAGATLGGIPIALVVLEDGTTLAAQLTDVAGVTEFKDVSLDRLARIAVQVQLQP